MEHALKPCPFCGNTSIKVGKYRAVAGVHYYAQCDYEQGGCGAELASRVSKKCAIEDWNKREETKQEEE